MNSPGGYVYILYGEDSFGRDEAVHTLKERMRALPATRDALLVALTGYGQKEDQQRATEAGFDRHFVKPTDPRVLVELIAGWEGPAAGRRAQDGRDAAAATAPTGQVASTTPASARP